jgi:hypothetical protein
MGTESWRLGAEQVVTFSVLEVLLRVEANGSRGVNVGGKGDNERSRWFALQNDQQSTNSLPQLLDCRGGRSGLS